jgi:hypothetical protein
MQLGKALPTGLYIAGPDRKAVKRWLQIRIALLLGAG